MATPKRTPLHALHRELGAKMVPFADYEMPLRYPSGIIAEHRHTRQHAGLFDVSHMGQLRLKGERAAAALESLVPADLVDLAVNRQRYALFTNDDGGILDDLMIGNVGDHLWLVVNAACKESDTAHLSAHLGDQCRIESLDDEALLALQGPQAGMVLRELAPDTADLVFMHTRRVAIAGTDCLVTRSGYTGEDGFEIVVADERAPGVWRALQRAGVAPCGLGARDTLRLEAGMNLYGSDMDEETTPLESGLAWTVAWEPRDRHFIGRLALERQRDAGVTRKLVGLVLLDKGVLRSHQQVVCGDGARGEITSGTFSPSLNRAIALARVPTAVQIGDSCQVEIRGRMLDARIVKYPFVRHGKSCLPAI